MQDNPFIASFGSTSDITYIPRYEEEETIINDFNRDFSSSQVYMLAGVRGIGKTALTTHITNTISKNDKKWKIVNLSSQGNLLKSLAANLQADPILNKVFLEKKLDFSLLGIGVSIEGGMKISDEEVMIRQMLTVMKALKKRLLVTIDEVSSQQNLRTFASSFQLYIRENLPIYLIMTGLYKDIKSLQTHKNMTFLKRAPRINLGLLDINMIAKKYASLFEVSFEEAARMAKITNGYSYAYSLFGNAWWDKKETVPDDELIARVKDILEDRAYSQIWEELSQLEKDFVIKMADMESPEEGAISIGAIVTALDKDATLINGYRKRLIDAGIITSPRHGFVKFTLPFFSESVNRLKMF